MNDHKAVLAGICKPGARHRCEDGRTLRVRRTPPVGAQRHEPTGNRQARASVEAGYLGDCFGAHSNRRSYGSRNRLTITLTWATADESRTEIIELYHRAREHSDATIAALSLDTVGRSHGGAKGGARSPCTTFWYT